MLVRFMAPAHQFGEVASARNAVFLVKRQVTKHGLP